MVVGTLIRSPKAQTVTPFLARVMASATSWLVVTQTGQPGPWWTSMPASSSIWVSPNLTMVS